MDGVDDFIALPSIQIDDLRDHARWLGQELELSDGCRATIHIQGRRLDRAANMLDAGAGE